MKTLIFTITVMLATATGFSQVTIGDTAPDFKLLNTDGKMISLSDFGKEKGVILVFTCNHCPYAKFYEQRIIDLNETYATQKYPVIAINPNDSAKYDVDGYSYMVAKKYKFPYLLDNKGVYAEYGATKTPHVFLLKNTGEQFIVSYIGAIDDSPQDPKEVKEKYLEIAIEAINEGNKPKYTTTKAIGCSIKPF